MNDFIKRNPWVMVSGLAVVALVVATLLYEGESETTTPHDDPAAEGLTSPADEPSFESEVESPPSPGARSVLPGGDGGVGVPRVTIRERRHPVSQHERAIVRQALDDGEHSAGFRLGQTRRNVAIFESRVEMLQANATRMRIEGHEDLAVRQEAVLERTQRRLDELRADEGELAAQAESDGTASDAPEGFGDGPPPPRDGPRPQATRPPG